MTYFDFFFFGGLFYNAVKVKSNMQIVMMTSQLVSYGLFQRDKILENTPPYGDFS